MVRREVKEMPDQKISVAGESASTETLVAQRCAYCQGTGEVEVGELVPVYQTCEVCEGYGQVRVPGDPVKCPRCKGTGAEDVGECIQWFLPCEKCHGTAWASPPPVYR
jgi:DnaJ-class molecular chaperone